MLCEYGCGQEALYQLKNGKNCCSKSSNSCPEIRRKNSEKIKELYKNGKKICGWKKLTNEQRAWSKGKKLIPMELVFIENSNKSTEYVKDYIIKYNIFPYLCNKCKLNIWQGEFLTLELNHINGNNKDNRLKNLEYLCPNCHSQTETWRGRNINKGKNRKMVSDKVLISLFKTSKNIRNLLLEAGLTPKGGNYIRIKKLIEKYNLKFNN